MPGLSHCRNSPGYFIFRADYARTKIAENSVFSAAAIGLCMTEKAAAQRKSAETGFGFLLVNFLCYIATNTW